MCRGGSQAPCQQWGLKKLPEAFCQLEADAKCIFLTLGQGREFPGLLSPYVICFQDYWKLPWSLEACVQSASRACQPCQSDKEISTSNRVFSFSLHCIKRILLFSALFQEQPEEYVVRYKSRQVHTTEPVFYTLPPFYTSALQLQSNPLHAAVDLWYPRQKQLDVVCVAPFYKGVEFFVVQELFKNLVLQH